MCTTRNFPLCGWHCCCCCFCCCTNAHNCLGEMALEPQSEQTIGNHACAGATCAKCIQRKRASTPTPPRLEMPGHSKLMTFTTTLPLLLQPPPPSGPSPPSTWARAFSGACKPRYTSDCSWLQGHLQHIICPLFDASLKLRPPRARSQAQFLRGGYKTPVTDSLAAADGVQMWHGGKGADTMPCNSESSQTRL